MLGSKIDNLIKLKENNVNVPNFKVLEFNFLFDGIKKLINENKNLESDKLSELLWNYIDDNLVIDLNFSLKGNKYAVRSSSNLEDSNDNSFAGQFDTYLNVSKKELKSKITSCVKSLYNKNVFDYVNARNIELSSLKMNVIVQEMVDSDYSGVLFTVNPLGILNESVIVVGEGLGEGVVSDKVVTTSYYYNITDKLYYYDGVKDYLDKDIIESLIDISFKIKDILGKYLDIEFGIVKDEIYILQARKITTIDDSNLLILDNSNIVESYPGISLPCTISFVNSVYSGVFEGLSRRVLKNERILNKNKHIFSNMVGASNGRIYYKISNWYSMLKFLPFNKKIIPIWQEMLGVRNKSYDNGKTDLNFFNKVMTYFNSFYELLMVPSNMDKLNKSFIEINSYFYDNFNKNMSSSSVIKLYRKIEKELLSCWDVTLLNDMYTFIFTGLLKGRLKKKYKDYDKKANEYISGISNIESMKPIMELIMLSYDKDFINEEEFDKRVSLYIEKYGDRNLEELKLESLTFRTNRELLFSKIDEYRSDKVKLNDLYEKIKFKKDVVIKEDFFTNFLIKRCMKGIKNREISRLNRSRIFGMVREMLLQIGNNFVKEKVISDKRDIFYLTIEEIQSLVNKKKCMKDVILERKNKYELYKLLPSYTRIVFMNKEFDKSNNSVNMNKFYIDNNMLKGIPCSNGIVEGEALVITDINGVLDVNDKILITKMTDPGWVFLLATAKGVISEKGSLLSHTAIISRELKIPSIVGVDKLLDTVKSGDIIKMDGNSGVVTIVKRGKR